MRRLVLLLFLLAGCSDAPAPKVKLRPGYSPAAKETSHEMRDGQLVVIDVPVTNSRGRVEIQRCFVWRERAVNSASMQCPSDGIDVPQTGDAVSAGPNY